MEKTNHIKKSTPLMAHWCEQNLRQKPSCGYVSLCAVLLGAHGQEHPGKWFSLPGPVDRKFNTKLKVGLLSRKRRINCSTIKYILKTRLL